MSTLSKINQSNETLLYDNILNLSRNKLFYTKFGLKDTFQNRIILIFFHISFLFIKSKNLDKNNIYKAFSQKVFDLIFKKIEINMRELGYGDVTVNKNMRILVKNFYNILLNCEGYKNENALNKKKLLYKYLDINNDNKNGNNTDLIDYFDKYQAFCFDLSLDSVLRCDFNFKNLLNL